MTALLRDSASQRRYSARDDVVIAACDEHGMAMAFSGLRLFHH